MTKSAHLPEPETLVLEIAGRRLHVCCWGKAASPALLLIHGIRDHARSWDWVAAELAGEYRIYAPDLRGHGNSDRTPPHGYTLAEFTLDIAEIVEALQLSPLAIAGHSFGGHIALRYTASWPDRVTALSGIECIEMPIMREQRANPKPYPRRMREWMEARRAGRDRAPRAYASIAEAEARMAREQPNVAADTIHHLAAHGLLAHPDGSWRWKFDQAPRLRPPDDADGLGLDEMLDAISCPVQLFYGTESYVPMPPPERLARLRNHRVVTVPGAGHWLHHQARQAYIAELRGFLAAHHKGQTYA